MKFGIDPPWYDDKVERTAFNLYAMNYSELDEIVERIKYGEDEIEDYDLTKEEYTYVTNALRR